MRNVVLYHLLSVDGVADAPDRYVDNFDDVMYENLRRVIDAQDAVLLGRRMYDEWAPYWPTSDDEPFATFINRVEKYVATSTPLQTSWANSRVIERPIVEFVQDLKNQSGHDIGVHGSVGLARSLLQAGLADELRLVVAPALAGSGRTLLGEASGAGAWTWYAARALRLERS